MPTVNINGKQSERNKHFFNRKMRDVSAHWLTIVISRMSFVGIFKVNQLDCRWCVNYGWSVRRKFVFNSKIKQNWKFSRWSGCRTRQTTFSSRCCYSGLYSRKKSSSDFSSWTTIQSNSSNNIRSTTSTFLARSQWISQCALLSIHSSSSIGLSRWCSMWSRQWTCDKYTRISTVSYWRNNWRNSTGTTGKCTRNCS